MKSKRLNTPTEIQIAFDKHWNSLSPEEDLEIDGLIIGQLFLMHVSNLAEAHAMSRKQLAEHMGITPSFLTQLFRGDRPLSDRNKAKLARIFGIQWKVEAVPVVKAYKKPKSIISAAAEPVASYGKSKSKVKKAR